MAAAVTGTSARPRPIRPWWASVVPLFVVVASLVLLALFSWRAQKGIQETRSFAVQRVEPLQRLVIRLQVVHAQDIAARRGLLVAADPAQFRVLHDLFVEEDRIHESLAAARDDMPAAVVQALERFDEAASAWDAVIRDDVLSGADPAAALAAALTPAADSAFDNVIAATGALDAALRDARDALRQQVLARERRQLEMTWALIALAMLAVATLFVLSRHTRRLALESRDRQQEVERLADEKERFIRGITHDLKNPLAAVDAYAQLLDAEIRGPLSADQREFVQRIRRATQETLGTVNDLLELSRAATASPSLKLAPADLRQLVVDVVESNRITAELFGVALDVDPGEPRTPFVTDAVRVRQVLGNLVSNAMKYSPRGGTVCVRLRARPDGWLAIDVEDEGPGIAVEERERVFDEFYRGAGDRPGSGLGLAASRRIAELLGGRVELETGPHGSTFTLVLPARADAPALARA